MERRCFLGLAASAFAQTKRPRVAAILNAYYPDSHADVFLGRLLGGYRLNGKSHQPRVDVVSFYVDQFPMKDMAGEQAEEYGITIYPTVAEALRLGGKRLAVDAVAIIGEHGVYPRTPRGNFQYPRWRYFEQVARVFREDAHVVPIYNDKYFAYDWSDARRMYDTVREMHIPFMAGSTVPLTWRRPALELPRGVRLTEALAVSYSDLEEHTYHAIELLQAMVERRAGGETGIQSVRCVEGPEVWAMADRGEWSRKLLHAALATRVNKVEQDRTVPPQAIFVKYRDGLKATILNLNGLTRDYLFAAQEVGRAEPHACCAYIQLYNHNHWSFMVRNFEDLVLTGTQPHPVERTLLATGITLFGLESRFRDHQWLPTPELAVRY